VLKKQWTSQKTQNLKVKILSTLLKKNKTKIKMNLSSKNLMLSHRMNMNKM